MFRRIFANLFITLASFYFFFHLVWGTRGYVNYSILKTQVDLKKLEYNSLVSQRTILESQVSLLQKTSLDLDFLDENAKKSLAICKPQELLFPIAEQR